MADEKEVVGVAAGMNTGVLSLFFCFFFLLPLSGCLDCERTSVSIDLVYKMAEVKFSNVVSNSTDEKTIREDFQDLIEKAYFDEASKSDPDRITSRRLYRNDERLDGVERFSFQSLARVLKEFNIETDKSGNYILDITKESENYQISGNGQPIGKDSKRFLKWPKNAKKIEFEENRKEFDETKKTSLLKPWLDWINKNTKKEQAK